MTQVKLFTKTILLVLLVLTNIQITNAQSSQDSKNNVLNQDKSFYKISLIVFAKEKNLNLAKFSHKEISNSIYNGLFTQNNIDNSLHKKDLSNLVSKALSVTNSETLFEQEIKILNDNNLALEALTLNNNPSYKVLSNIGWIQEADTDKELAIGNQKSPNTSKSIYGTVKFSQKRFLHFDLDLNYLLPLDSNIQEQIFNVLFDKKKQFMELNPQNITLQKLKKFYIKKLDLSTVSDKYLKINLKTNTKMKTEELFYFDNPVFGAIVLVNRI